MSKIIRPKRLERLVTEIFTQSGCSRKEAERVSIRLVKANLTGHDSHGVIRTARYVDWLKTGLYNADQSITILMENDILAIVDGGYGFGQTVAEQAVELGLQNVRKSGVTVVALRNAGHIGRVGDWAEMAADAGFISIHFVNARGSILVAPFGATSARYSTAPFCAGIPRDGGNPMILDFATSKVAEGKVLIAAKGGKSLPNDALIHGNGQLTSDPIALYGDAGPDAAPGDRNGTGAIRTMGDHKGSGLAMLCELLGGALTGNGTTGPWQTRFANGMLSIYLSVESFDQGNTFAEEVRRYIDYVRDANSASAEDIMIPGDPERKSMAERTENGIPLSEDAWSSIRNTALTSGIPAEKITELSGIL